MLIRLIYVSTAQDGVDLNEFKRILLQAQTNNDHNDLTGMLAFNSKIFLQAIEGSRDKVNELYARIMRDLRHQKITILSLKEIEERHWSNWSMGHAAPNTSNRALFLKYSQQSTFNPYAMNADAAEKMLMELANTNAAMVTPSLSAPVAPAMAAIAPVAESSAPAAANTGIFGRFLKK